jgi:hypothetical protein
MYLFMELYAKLPLTIREVFIINLGKYSHYFVTVKAHPKIFCSTLSCFDGQMHIHIFLFLCLVLFSSFSTIASVDYIAFKD